MYPTLYIEADELKNFARDEQPDKNDLEAD